MNTTRDQLRAEVERLKAHNNGQHVRNYHEMIEAQKERDASIARAENAERERDGAINEIKKVREMLQMEEDDDDILGKIKISYNNSSDMITRSEKAFQERDAAIAKLDAERAVSAGLREELNQRYTNLTPTRLIQLGSLLKDPAWEAIKTDRDYAASQAIQLIGERDTIRAEVERLKAHNNGQHVRNYREMIEAQKERDAAIDHAEKLEGFLRDLLVCRQTLDAINPEFIHRIDAALADGGGK